MKKTVLQLIFLLMTFMLFSQENEKIIDYMRNNGRVWSQNEEDNGLVYITYESLDDNFFFVIGNGLTVFVNNVVPFYQGVKQYMLAYFLQFLICNY